MDLKEVHLVDDVDDATNYTAAAIIKDKTKNIFVNRIFKIWLAYMYFGVPKKFQSDCGGEFANNVFQEMNEKFGTETSTTPGESPFSSGMLYETMMKTMEDVNWRLHLHGLFLQRTLYKIHLDTVPISWYMGEISY